MSDTTNLPTPARALAIGAHPDDAEFGVGGTLRKWSRDGCEGFILVLTDGAKGTWDAAADPRELVKARQEEQRKAAEVLGLADVFFAGHVDGELEYGMSLREEVCGWIRRIRPDVVIGHDPWRRYMWHPDHRAAGWAAVDGVVAARDHLFFPGQEWGNHRPSALLLWAADDPDHREDITTEFEAKLEALLCHASQGVSTMRDAQASTEKAAEFRAHLEQWNAAMGGPVGFTFGEAFRRMTP